MRTCPPPELLGKLDAKHFDLREVNIEMDDGSTARFRYAFYRVEGEWTVIYTEHCGYLSFLTASIKQISGLHKVKP